ncbi:hypothetical protein N9P55_00425 [bacterium]|nr:hypothetical protein [bacterium]MDB4088205.1 hypothetical protein [Flavobacteriales bacterium]
MKISVKHIYKVIAILLLSSQISFAQFFKTYIDKDSILIGEPIELNIVYSSSKVSSGFNFEEGDSIGNGFEILEILDTGTRRGGAEIFKKYSITSFEIGNHFIPSFSIYYDSNRIVSKPIPVHISLMRVDTTQPIKYIKPIIYDELTFGDRASRTWNWMKKYWFIWIPILLGLLVLVWFLFIKKKKEKVIKEQIKEIIPAHILASSRLNDLEEKQLWQNGKQKEYNVQLTEVIQEYITNRYNVPTSERTSAEIIQSLRFVEMGDDNKANLRELLMLSDLVKFAKELPTPDENKKVLRNGYQFVKTTKKTKI